MIVPMVIMLISFKVYNNTGNKKNLVMYTLPNFILAVVITTMMSPFAMYGNNYIEAFSAFINGISNINIFLAATFKTFSNIRKIIATRETFSPAYTKILL